MKNAIRCFLSCILPCGALDVIRIVHCNGRVEEISGTVRAEEVMRAHPMHVLKKQSSPSADEAVVPKIVVVPPDAELKRGSIYFLMPAAEKPEKKPSLSGRRGLSSRRKRRAAECGRDSLTNPLISDRYLTDILSEKQSSQRDRRRGRVGIWRPHLESIYEASSDL